MNNSVFESDTLSQLLWKECKFQLHFDDGVEDVRSDVAEVAENHFSRGHPEDWPMAVAGISWAAAEATEYPDE